MFVEINCRASGRVVGEAVIQKGLDGEWFSSLSHQIRREFDKDDISEVTVWAHVIPRGCFALCLTLSVFTLILTR